ncbi:DNA-binding ferritin-like protein [Paenibacillus mucilaginosus 3016]|uniref:DNA-binding ferritin-like protein n=2 Tax=Paenibacillus mucilaginosus TaxID=61624 RepID=H6NIW1_9BACL|nr:Dps family protein [Paenibacillus mucilaginosus]AFC34011.1 DNA-binding ferritin-like protein [Paenibacillus mucilaginosus 3016]AFH66339.1 general stress protein [Paenibacillus mucilaginosus K02]WFA22377.1 DNA starvation/stationary phase protection protein [Paenibacillus mucilaginosus]
MTIEAFLNKHIADWNVLYVKLRHYHWNVTGKQFFTLHTKFGELYSEAAVHVDELAERLLALGRRPVSTMTGYLELASIREAAGNESTADMVQAVAGDYTRMITGLKQGMEIAASAGDETTGDLLLAIRTSLEKQVWMMNAFLGNESLA